MSIYKLESNVAPPPSLNIKERRNRLLPQMAKKNHKYDIMTHVQGSKEKADATHNEEMMLMVKRAGGGGGGGNIKDEVINNDDTCEW